MSHTFDTAFYRYACALEARGETTSDREWVCREVSSLNKSEDAYILRGVGEHEIARVNKDNKVQIFDLA